MSDPFMSAEPAFPAELEKIELEIVKAPVEEAPPAPSEIADVVVEPPPSLADLRVTAEGVVLSKVERSLEGVILKVLEI